MMFVRIQKNMRCVCGNPCDNFLNLLRCESTILQIHSLLSFARHSHRLKDSKKNETLHHPCKIVCIQSSSPNRLWHWYLHCREVFCRCQSEKRTKCFTSTSIWCDYEQEILTWLVFLSYCPHDPHTPYRSGDNINAYKCPHHQQAVGQTSCTYVYVSSWRSKNETLP